MNPKSLLQATTLFLAGALASACGTANSPAAPLPLANLAPVVVVRQPAQAVRLDPAAGGTVSIEYIDADANGMAMTDIIADQDGDLATTADQVVIDLDRPAVNGMPQTLSWDVQGAPAGIYRVFARTSDGLEVVTAEAPAAVTLGPTPTLEITTPASDQLVSRGGILSIGYRHAGLPAGTIRFVSDEDGDPATTSDQEEMAFMPTAQPGGIEHVFVWDSTNSTATDFAVLATATNGAGAPLEAAAPGRVRIENVAFVREVGPEESSGRAYSEARDLAALPDGGSIVVGEFAERVVFGQGEPNEVALESVTTNRDLFVARYNPDGTLAWVRAAGGDGRESSAVVAALPDGSSILGVEGDNQSVVFDRGGPNETSLTVASNSVVLARYAPDGTFLGVREVATGTSLFSLDDLCALSDGTLFATGLYRAQATFGAGQPDETSLLNLNDQDIWIARIEADLSFGWVRGLGSTDNERGRAISCAAGIGITVAGTFEGETVFGFGEPTETTLSTPAGNDEDYFVARYGFDGSFVWVRRTSSPMEDVARSVAMFADGSVVVGGSFRATATFGAGEATETLLTARGEGDGFVARYGPDGAFEWVRAIGGNAFDDDRVDSVSAVADGSCLITGSYHDQAFLAGSSDLFAVGGEDIFVARYGARGRLEWVRSFGSTSTDEAGEIAAALDGSAILIGSVFDPTRFGGSDPRAQLLTPVGSVAYFLARFNADGGF